MEERALRPPMRDMLPRSLLPVMAAALALCAWLHARGFAALVGGGLTSPHLIAFAGAQAAPAVIPPRSAAPILARNPFDSVTGALDAPAPAADPGEGAIPRCEGVNVVSIVGSQDPARSLVMLQLDGEHEPILRRCGGEILAIESNRVLLRRNGKRCIARIFARETVSPPAAVTGSADSLTRGIAATGPGSFAVDRGARDALIEGAATLMRSIAVRPEMQGTDVIGLRVATLQPGTPLDALGIRAGDVLLSLDGIPLSSPDRMLDAYTRIRTEDRLRLVVSRDARTVQMDYQVR